MFTSIEELKKATLALEKALSAEKTELNRDATIQRFEFCIELAWKSARRVMGTSTSAPKQVVREMAQNNLIEDIEIWLSAIDQRNLTAHTYNESLAEQVYEFAKKFLPACQKLLKVLEKA